MSDIFALLCFCGMSFYSGEAGEYAREWRDARENDKQRVQYYKSQCLWATAVGAAFAAAVWVNINKQIDAGKAEQKSKIETAQRPANSQTNAATMQWKNAMQKTR